jgi:hypothetical protein
MKAYGGMDVWIHVFFTSALVGVEWSSSRPGRFIPREIGPGRRLGGPQNQSGRCGKEKNLTMPGIEPVAIPTELSRLLKRRIRRKGR